MRLAVIRDGIVFGGDRYLFPSQTTLGHRQGAFGLGDVVVVRLGAVLQRVGKVVLAAAYRCLAAGDGVGCTLALCESVSAYRDCIIRQRLAVVGLRCAFRGQRHRPLGDR